MPTSDLSPSVAIAALLKSQLDQGKDYFELLAPIVQRGVGTIAGDIVEPLALQRSIEALSGLTIPLRTIAVLLNRLASRAGTGIRKEGSAFLRTSASQPLETPVQLLSDFNDLGEAFASFSEGRLASVKDARTALDTLSSFLETHSTTLLLDQPLSSPRTGRKEDIVVASFLTVRLGAGDQVGRALTALLQGLVLARAVTLTDLASIERRLEKLVVYFDTPFVLTIAGLCGTADLEAAREAVRMLKALGATPALFDETIAEVRRVLAVYEDRLDTAEGRASLRWTPLTAHLLSINATGADVRGISSLLERQLAREGLNIHTTPPRDRDYVADETALTKALKDVRGDGHEAREDHDIDCVAAILTLRRGREAATLEDARAVFAATGLVVKTTRAWWSETGAKGIPPVIEHSALINYCWLKRPGFSTGVHRFELAALCSSILQPSQAAWDRFRKELRKLTESGQLTTDEESVILIDSYASKLLVETEESDTIGSGTVADIVQRVRDEHQREAANARTEAAAERLRRMEEQSLAEERRLRELEEKDKIYGERLTALRGELTEEQGRVAALEGAILGISRILAWMLTVPVLGVILATVTAAILFPVIDASTLPAGVRTVLHVVAVLVGLAGGIFGLSALSLAKPLQRKIETRIASILRSRA